MDGFSEWLAGIAPKVEEGTLLHKAVVYAQNQFPYLYNALADGDLPIENNRALPPVPDDAQFLTPAA